MKDRAVELAKALCNNPWVDTKVREVCRAIILLWAEEDNKIDDFFNTTG